MATWATGTTAGFGSNVSVYKQMGKDQEERTNNLIAYQQQQIEDHKRMVEYLNRQYMATYVPIVRETKKPMYYKQFEEKGFTRGQVDDVLRGDIFDDDRNCEEHGDYECVNCIWKELNKTKVSGLPMLLSTAENYKTLDKQEIQENFESQVGFIQKGLGLSDTQVAKLKIKEMPKKMKEAQENITVGSMRELMEERLKPVGFLGGLFKIRKVTIEK